jgi:hypothetical protein
MITEDNMAAARMAQIFGSELLKVQENAKMDSGSVPEIVKIDPKQFLLGGGTSNRRNRHEEQRIIDTLQSEAEMSYPLPDQSDSPAPLPISLHHSATEQTIAHQHHTILSQQVLPIQSTHVDGITEQLQNMNRTLLKIADSLEKVDFIFKRNTIIEHDNNS